MTTSACNHALALALSLALAPIGCAAAPLTPDVDGRVRAAVNDVRRAYPELEGRAVSLASLDERTVFFQSNFEPEVLGDAPLAYSIQANPRAFALGLDDEALRGVIAHELAHTLDYETRTKQGTNKLALLQLLPLVVDPSSNTWERWTDLVAVDRGFGPALLRYRAWQFRVLDDEAVAMKKRVYYGPLELSLLLDVRARCPALFQTYLARPPTSARAIATRCP